MSFRFFNPAEHTTISQGHLPHWDQAEATYFITWRTADSMPRDVWLKWRHERDGWLLEHGISPLAKDWRRQVEELSDEERNDFRQFSRRLENEMDACHGECLLRQPALASHVAEALRFFDGSRYSLGDFVIMPNHVHLLVGGLGSAFYASTGGLMEKVVGIEDQRGFGSKRQVLAGRKLRSPGAASGCI